MFFGTFKESRPVEGDWEVSLPDEEPQSLLTILNIIHGRFAEVPKKPSLEQLYLILALAHKYDMLQQVRPWAPLWGEAVSRFAEQSKVNVKWLTFVTWELGNERIFRSVVEDLVFDCTADSEGRLMTPEGHCLDDFDHFGPRGLTGK